MVRPRRLLCGARSFLRGILDSAPAFSRRIHAHNTSVTEVRREVGGAVGTAAGCAGVADPDVRAANWPQVVWLEREQTWELARVNDCTHLALDEELTGKMPAAAG